jgi:hypothetical protein
VRNAAIDSDLPEETRGSARILAAHRRRDSNPDSETDRSVTRDDSETDPFREAAE